MATLGEKQAEYLTALKAIYDFSEVRAITQWVVEDVMNIKASRLSMDRYRILTTHQEELLNAHLQRLLHHEPIQYVLGYAEFFGLKFKVNPAVLIPRPETEELVRWIIEQEGERKGISLLDIGTGSGCIPVSLKKALPHVAIDAIDISREALEVAEENARINETKISFSMLNILTDIPASRYDIIVSNPPYISPEEKKKMSDNVLCYEPHLALFSDDALLFYKRIAEIAAQVLHPNGTIYLEVGEQQAEQVEAIFSAVAAQTTVKKDMSGKDRMVRARFS